MKVSLQSQLQLAAVTERLTGKLNITVNYRPEIVEVKEKKKALQ